MAPMQHATPKEPLARCYWISGDETLLVQEARDRILANAFSSGFTEKNVVHVDVWMPNSYY